MLPFGCAYKYPFMPSHSSYKSYNYLLLRKMRCLPKAFQLLYLVFFLLSFQANLSSCSSSTTRLCSPEEAAALLQFKTSFSIDNTSYSSQSCDNLETKSYPKTNSWKKGLDCCSWDGVSCDHIKGHVIGLDLSCSQLSGSFPSNSTLLHLPHLQKLNLAFNDFYPSNISSVFGGFPSTLVYLNLSGSAFAGQIPSQVSHLSKLVSLDLSLNFVLIFDKHSLEGLVENLTEVRHLALDDTDMSSIDPHALMNLSSSLRILSLKNCGLLGNFPTSIFHLPNLESLSLRSNIGLILHFPKLNWRSNLKSLDISEISLSRKSIDSIANLKSLKYLDLSDNYILEGLPELIRNLSSLEHLDASHSTLSEGFLDSITSLVSLEYLDLRFCDLSGSILRSLGNLSRLSLLDLSNNNLSGQIPFSFTNLSQLEFLQLSGNQLGGSMLDEETAFPKLISLDVSSNLLIGKLPSWLYTISTLKYIYLSNNQLSGNIKEFRYKSLKKMSFRKNKLSGPLPSSISQFVNLTLLDLSSNHLSGILEFDMLSKLQNLQELDLSFNSLSLNSNGTVLDYALPNLQSLHLPSCNVREFPKFLRGTKWLQYLDLSDNKIQGKIPEWMWDVGKTTLFYLNLSHNLLTDFEQIPWEIISYVDLSSNLIHGDLPIPPPTTKLFFFSNNNLSREIPSQICSAYSLQFLDLSRNNLSGNIPHCLENLSQSLLVMNLGMNQFHGIIPPIFMKGCQLTNLNLNGNQLEGPLTHSIMNCTELKVLDLGNNKINGTFPHWLGSLPYLKVLVLHSNQLHGSIHGKRSNHSFSKVQIFDLSGNHFTGQLPVHYIKSFKAIMDITKEEDVESYMGLWDDRGGSFYSYSITTTLKGQNIQMVKIFVMLTTIDFSNNEFKGEISKVIGELKSLKGLNLSHNNLSGHIPISLGNLTALESLDLSSNKLVGRIPTELTSLASLAVFNLSQNQLVGPIPQGNQFNTFSNDSYASNLGLCGFPLSKSCGKNEAPVSNEEHEVDSEIVFKWKAALMGYGSGLVFGISAAYIMFTLGKPVWLIKVVEVGGYRLKRYLRGRRIL